MDNECNIIEYKFARQTTKKLHSFIIENDLQATMLNRELNSPTKNP